MQSVQKCFETMLLCWETRKSANLGHSSRCAHLASLNTRGRAGGSIHFCAAALSVILPISWTRFCHQPRWRGLSWSCSSVVQHARGPGLDPQHHHRKLGVEVRACNSNTREVEAGGSETQGCLQLCSELKSQPGL